MKVSKRSIIPVAACAGIAVAIGYYWVSVSDDEGEAETASQGNADSIVVDRPTQDSVPDYTQAAPLQSIPQVDRTMKRLSPGESTRYAPFSVASLTDIEEAFAPAYASDDLDFLTEGMMADIELTVRDHLGWLLTGKAEFLNARYARINPAYLEKNGLFDEESAREHYRRVFRGNEKSLPEDNEIEIVGFTNSPLAIAKGDPTMAFNERLRKGAKSTLRKSLARLNEKDDFNLDEAIFFEVGTIAKTKGEYWWAISTVWRWNEKTQRAIPLFEQMSKLRDPRIAVPSYFHGMNN